MSSADNYTSLFSNSSQQQVECETSFSFYLCLLEQTVCVATFFCTVLFQIFLAILYYCKTGTTPKIESIREHLRELKTPNNSAHSLTPLNEYTKEPGPNTTLSSSAASEESKSTSHNG
jgi:hypothetical protein